MGSFSKTVKHNFFKPCIIKVVREYFKYVLLSITFDLYLGHKLSTNFKWTVSISQELSI